MNFGEDLALLQTVFGALAIVLALVALRETRNIAEGAARASQSAEEAARLRAEAAEEASVRRAEAAEARAIDRQRLAVTQAHNSVIDVVAHLGRDLAATGDHAIARNRQNPPIGDSATRIGFERAMGDVYDALEELRASSSTNAALVLAVSRLRRSISPEVYGNWYLMVGPRADLPNLMEATVATISALTLRIEQLRIE